MQLVTKEQRFLATNCKLVYFVLLSRFASTEIEYMYAMTLIIIKITTKKKKKKKQQQKNKKKNNNNKTTRKGYYRYLDLWLCILQSQRVEHLYNSEFNMRSNR